MEKIRNPGKLLASLFGNILNQNGVTYRKLEELISEHAQKVKRNNTSSVNIGSYKGNLKKELFTNKLTFNSFVKGLKVLNPVKVTFTITIKFRLSETVHSVELDLNNNILEEKDDE